MFKVLEFDSMWVSSLEVLFPSEKIAPNKTAKEIIKYFKKNKKQLTIHGTNYDDDPLGTNIKSSIKIVKLKNKEKLK